ncbi:MAG TPA: hypothetical protein VFY78_04225, partial [Gammaproteobacteria bacterium]|nr:hypothetical protein [Gammaproteobacteria bacterium]
WRDFKSVRFSVFSTLNSPVQMQLKIYDALHLSGGYKYADRFNRELIIHPGWNDIAVPVDDVRQAPLGRQMQLENIAGVSLFIQQLQQPAVFYVDGLHLSSR